MQASQKDYFLSRFVEILKKFTANDIQIILTGTAGEEQLIEKLCADLDNKALSVAGKLSLPEFMAAIDIAPAVLTVNTGTVHIAAALNTPVAVLYAATNPQHTPWNVVNKIFLFPVAEELQSKNEVIAYVRDNIMQKCQSYPDPAEVAQWVMSSMQTVHQPHA